MKGAAHSEMAIYRTYDDGLELHVVDHGVRWQFTLMMGEERVSGLGLVKKRMRIGGAVVKMGGIAGVWTSQDHRRKGYASRVMDASVEFMREKRYETSILFGIRDFYHRYGFVEVFPESVLDAAASDLHGAAGTYTVRNARKADLPALARLYNRQNQGRTGTVVRAKDWDPAWRLPRLGPDTVRRPGKTIVACDRRDRIRGYVVYDVQKARFRASEVVAADGEACGALAGAMARRARQGKAERVVVHLPADAPFVEYAKRCGFRLNRSYAGNGGSMGRVIDVGRLAVALLPDFEKRLAEPGVSFEQPLALATDVGAVTLSPGDPTPTVATGSSRGAIVVRVPQEVVTLWAMGSEPVEVAASRFGVAVPGRALPVLKALFPVGCPYVGWPDRF